MSSTDSRWFLKPPSSESRVRLFCFPYSGCGASMFRGWPARLGEAGEVEVVPLQLPGRENRTREGHFGTYEKLADAAVDGIAPYLDRPYAVFGHCGGALPAFETVLRVQERGLRLPERVFVSSQVAPQDGPYGRFLRLSPAELERELRGLLAALGSPAPRSEMVELFLDVLIADVEANKRYHREAVPLGCPVTVIGWSDDVEVPHHLMTGWDAWAPCEKTVLAGSHYTFLDAPGELTETLARFLSPVNPRS
ncbi:thioesterase II family protein [Streptosporangium becharense]